MSLDESHQYNRTRPKNYLKKHAIAQSQFGTHVKYDPQLIKPKTINHNYNNNSKLGENYYSDNDKVKLARTVLYQPPTTSGNENLIKFVQNEFSQASWLSECTNRTTTLTLVNYKLKACPVDVFGMVYLQSLLLSNNSITNLPRAIGNLVNLKILDLSFNQLVELPAEIGQSTLKETTTFAIGGMLELEKLLVGQNKLTALPSGIGR
tara:strand:- start:24 stop:644 length:621 start_codon:yes stop_codon:yes gene_type:complete